MAFHVRFVPPFSLVYLPPPCYAEPRGRGLSTKLKMIPDGGPQILGTAETPDPSERRAHQRIQVLLEVDYRADDTFLFAYITDISAMGIFVRTAQPETPGTRIFLRFTPPPASLESDSRPDPTALELEALSQSVTSSSQDHRDSIESFLAKKPATFHGR